MKFKICVTAVGAGIAFTDSALNSFLISSLSIRCIGEVGMDGWTHSSKEEENGGVLGPLNTEK